MINDVQILSKMTPYTLGTRDTSSGCSIATSELNTANRLALSGTLENRASGGLLQEYMFCLREDSSLPSHLQVEVALLYPRTCPTVLRFRLRYLIMKIIFVF
ncbi:hypothetical protein MTR67_019550 [Solanum verrucosum]|uniref:Uncharacterized protein n=1 Tax=Solanum verrucosum TaxID=315347 RepID=A0AAF0QPE8_SOLVR|nr:hypothetical protein MTR67_019550 [Solanum verrucosum]